MPVPAPETNPKPDDGVLDPLPHLDYTFEDDADDVAQASELDETDIGDEQRGSTPYSPDERLRQSMFSSPEQTRASTDAVLKLVYRPAFATVLMTVAQQGYVNHEITHLQYMSMLVFVVLPLLGVHARKKSGDERDDNKKT